MFKLVLMPPDFEPEWPAKIETAVPECKVQVFGGAQDLADADALFGSLPRELFAAAPKLRWICASRAGLGGSWFYPELVESEIVVTGMHGSYNEHLSTHAIAFVLAFARRFDEYLPRQPEASWGSRWPMLDLTHSTAVIVGTGGAGAEAGRLCAAFGMRVLGFDPRVTTAPEGFESVQSPERMDERLGEADFVIVTAPETPATLGMFNAARFARMKQGAYFVNISRGKLVVTDDLVQALRSGHLAGAGLDVVDPEPLPSQHPLWRMANVLITPHVAIYGTPYKERWLALLIKNCGRFAKGEALRNVVDKRQWF